MSGVPLGELEFAIMDFVWKRGRPVTVPDVQRHLSKSRNLAYTTTMTVMSRLYEKGLLSRSEERRPYSYWAAVPREDFTADLMLGILSELGDRKSVLARFVDKIGAKDAQLLKDLMARRKGRRA